LLLCWEPVLSTTVWSFVNVGQSQKYYAIQWDTTTGNVARNISLYDNCPMWTFSYLTMTGAYDPGHNVIVFLANSFAADRFTYYRLDLSSGLCTLWNPNIPRWKDLSTWYSLIRYDNETSEVVLCAEMVPYSGYKSNLYQCYGVDLGTDKFQYAVTVPVSNNTNPLGPEGSGNLGGWMDTGSQVGFYIQTNVQDNMNYTWHLGYVQLSPTPAFKDFGVADLPLKSLLSSNHTLMVSGGTCSQLGGFRLDALDIASREVSSFFWDFRGRRYDGSRCKAGEYEAPIINSLVWIEKDVFLAVSDSYSATYVQFDIASLEVKVINIDPAWSAFVPLVLL